MAITPYGHPMQVTTRVRVGRHGTDTGPSLSAHAARARLARLVLAVWYPVAFAAFAAFDGSNERRLAARSQDLRARL